MALAFDPGDDFARISDGLENVTFSKPGSSVTVAVAHALRRGVTLREAEKSGGRVTAADVVWQLPVAELPDHPQPGDAIVDGDGWRWTLLEVQAAAVAGRWRCVARNLAVAHRLDDVVEIQEATYAKGAGGAAEPAWHTWQTGLRARIQPALVEMVGERQRQITRSLYLIYLEQNVTVGRNHRIKGPDGTLYRIAGSRRARRIDTVMEIDAIKIAPSP